MIASSASPSIPSDIKDPSNLSTHCFRNDEEIIKALSTPDYPWDDMHHHLFFVPDEPLSSLDLYSVEAKYFIHGKVNELKNSIPAPNAFEEGNMENIQPTIKVNISNNPQVVEYITLGASFSPE